MSFLNILAIDTSNKVLLEVWYCYCCCSVTQVCPTFCDPITQKDDIELTDQPVRAQSWLLRCSFEIYLWLISVGLLGNICILLNNFILWELYLPFLSTVSSFSPRPFTHTDTHRHTHTIHNPIQWWASSYKNILWNYWTIVTEFIFQIWTGEFMMVRRLFMLKPLKWKLWTDISLGNRKWTRLWLGLKFISFPGRKRLFDEWRSWFDCKVFLSVPHICELWSCILTAQN